MAEGQPHTDSLDASFTESYANDIENQLLGPDEFPSEDSSPSLKSGSTNKRTAKIEEK